MPIGKLKEMLVAMIKMLQNEARQNTKKWSGIKQWENLKLHQQTKYMNTP